MSRVYSEPFALVPEWLLDADISDRAVRLFGILHRYGGADGKAFPGRKRLADRLRTSVDSIDRATAELVKVGAVIVQPSFRTDGSQTSNNYWLWPCNPASTSEAPGPHASPHPSAPVPPPVGTDAAPKKENQGNENQGTREPSLARPDAPGFDAFWSAYPKKVDKGAARTAWPAAARKADPEVIVAGAVRYAAQRAGQDPGFTKNPATWLRAEAWANGPQANGRAGPHPAKVWAVDTDRDAPTGRLEL